MSFNPEQTYIVFFNQLKKKKYDLFNTNRLFIDLKLNDQLMRNGNNTFIASHRFLINYHNIEYWWQFECPYDSNVLVQPTYVLN